MSYHCSVYASQTLYACPVKKPRQEVGTTAQAGKPWRSMCSLHHLFAFPFLSSWMLLPYMPLLMTGTATFFQNKINANLTWKICLLQFLVKNLLHLIHHITPSYNGNGYLLNSKVCSYCCIWSVKTWECSIWEEDSLLVGVRILLSLSEVQEISESQWGRFCNLIQGVQGSLNPGVGWLFSDNLDTIPVLGCSRHLCNCFTWLLHTILLQSSQGPENSL